MNRTRQAATSARGPAAGGPHTRRAGDRLWQALLSTLLLVLILFGDAIVPTEDPPLRESHGLAFHAEPNRPFP